jgi:phosphoglycolate phosphatase-like HAD superfamily hydrolase
MRLSLDPVLFRAALRRVALGQIVADDHGRLRHHTDVLVPHVLATLDTLHQHEFIALVPDSTRPHRQAVVLTLTGTQLLDWLNRQQTTAGPERSPDQLRASMSEVASRGQSS